MTDRKVNPDRNLLFSQRHGHLPLPDVMNPNLCKQFRDEFCFIVKQSIDSSIGHTPYGGVYFKSHTCWEEVITRFQTQVLDVSAPNVETSARIVPNRVENIIVEAPAHHILSLIEIILRIDNGVHNDAIRPRILQLFNTGLAPYAIDDSAQPICIVPVDSPENAKNIEEALGTLNRMEANNSFQHLRNAADAINSNSHKYAVDESIKALEAIARDLTGESTLGAAAKSLVSKEVIADKQLGDAIHKLYGYASDKVRHGQPSEKDTEVNRDDALLVFGLCASISAYLAKKKNPAG